MEGIIKKPYEISLWEDVLTFVYENGKESEGKIIDSYGAIKTQYFKEKKICVIGSDTMNTPIRAVQPKLTINVNGSITLSFVMYYRYYDEVTNQFYNNPFIKNLLFNERKVKVRYGDLDDPDVKWYDLVIKNVQESSDQKSITYTAKSLFVNELSKSGFDLVFDTELENNMGTVEELGERVLTGSDWQLKPSGETIKQTKEEPLYKIVLKKGFLLSAKNMEKEEVITLGRDSEKDYVIYASYSDITEKNLPIQFIYSTEGYPTDDDFVITKKESNWETVSLINDNGEPIDITYEENIPNFAEYMTISEQYRGQKLVRNAIIKYDSKINKYVYVYKGPDPNSASNKKEYYGYSETTYESPATIRNLVTNPDNFDSTAGWKTYWKGNQAPIASELTSITVPDFREASNTTETEYKSCLKFKTTNTNQCLINSGIMDNRSFIENFTEDERYVFIIKYFKKGEEGVYGPKTLIPPTDRIHFFVGEYKISGDNIIFSPEEALFSGSIQPSNNASDGVYTRTEFTHRSGCKRTVSYKDLTDPSKRWGIILYAESGTHYIESVQFFKEVKKASAENDQRDFIIPGEIETEGVVTKTYYYYDPSQSYTGADNLVFAYQGYRPSDKYVLQYRQGFDKVRSIAASESNRFNLIQDLCEIFECWADFTIEHERNGQIKLVNYQQQKYVTFREYIGKPNYAGFKYGINLKSIQRTIDSDAIVTKLIVKNNANEFATDGFCSIARAIENPSGENFLLDFDYYIHHNMLGFAEVNNDLYSPVPDQGYIGYYRKLKTINAARDAQIAKQSGLLKDISQYESLYQTYITALNGAQEQLNNKEADILQQTGYTYQQLLTAWRGSATDTKLQSWSEQEDVIALGQAIAHLKNLVVKYDGLQKAAWTNLSMSKEEFDKCNRILTSTEKHETEPRLLLEKEALNEAFYKKYSRFLQEGSWNSEDYTDDNLYYLDAVSTLHTSSQPKVTYTINVLELSQLYGYENYKFDVGDKTYIEDTEFFGWVDKNNNGILTPYQEEIVVTEVTLMLDSPESNQIKVQNYKTQFEDLFQRMAAATQSVEYGTGKYEKASNIVKPDGTIKIDTLQNSIANNALTLQNVKDQTVIWDETGITTTSPSSPAKIVKITNGGIFLTVDGGMTWTTGIRGDGINASVITTGVVNTDAVNILSGGTPSFRWDRKGISAYEFTVTESNFVTSSYNPGKYVRFDQYGLYGIQDNADFDATIPERNSDNEQIIGEDKIWKYANFAVTWKGFKMKTSNGSVSISSDNDFQVIDRNNIERIKIGSLNSSNDIYGIRICNGAGAVVMEQDSDGDMWIKNQLKIGQNNSQVSIGYLIGQNYPSKEVETTENNQTTKVTYKQVVNANNKFIVYEDGSIKATEGYFEGEINANSGKFTGTIIATKGQIGQLTIDANGLVGETEKKRISLSHEGIVIEGGAFSILSEKQAEGKSPKQLLGFNEDGDLTISGVINASSGVFNGTVNANSGTFSGDITLGGDLIVSTSEGGTIIIGTKDNKTGIFTNDFSENSDNGFFISPNGFIKANNITLHKATLTDTLTIGETCEISKPNNSGEAVFKIYKKDENGNEKAVFRITDAGVLLLGGADSDSAIQLIGERQTIRTSNFITGGAGWSISPSKAEFNNVVVRGTIESSVIAHGEVQAVGGALIVRPSCIIQKSYKKIENDEIQLTIIFEGSNPGFSDQEYCAIGDRYFVILSAPAQVANSNALSMRLKQVTKEIKEESIIAETSDWQETSEYNGKILVGYGKDNSISIVLNSSENSSVGMPNAITIYNNTFETEVDIAGNSGIIHNKKAVVALGKMNGDPGVGGLTGYGLYADNVYLRGSLIARGKRSSNEEYYSGINTKSTVIMPNYDNLFTNKRGEIILWAGAKGSEDDDVKNAPFKVDVNGNFYASSGYFEGSIISKATITAAKIQTATIIGNSEQEEYGLKINAEKGILFLSGNEDNDSSFKMRLHSNGINLNIPLTISESIFGTSEKIITGFGKTGAGEENIRESYLTAGELYLSQGEKKKTGAIISREALDIYLNGDSKQENIMKIAREKVTINKDLTCEENIMLNDVIEYRKVIEIVNGEELVVGYDLYVKE